MKTDTIISQQIQQITNLNDIYQQWSQLEDPKHKLSRITAILPFVSLAGVLLKQNPNVNIQTQEFTVNKSNLLYKCAWSPMEGHTFSYAPSKVWVNGTLSYSDGLIGELNPQRLLFNR
jgi:hypothetical protein